MAKVRVLTLLFGSSLSVWDGTGPCVYTSSLTLFHLCVFLCQKKIGRMLIKFVSSAGTGYTYMGSKNPMNVRASFMFFACWFVYLWWRLSQFLLSYFPFPFCCCYYLFMLVH